MAHVLSGSRIIMHDGAYRSRLRSQEVGKKSARIRARIVRRGVGIAAVAIALALVFVWTRVRVIQLGYEVSQLNRQIGDLMRQKNLLEVEVARLKSPDRLEQMAQDRFHMRLPTGNEIVFMTQSTKTPEEIRHARRRAEYMAGIERARQAIEQAHNLEQMNADSNAAGGATTVPSIEASD